MSWLATFFKTLYFLKWCPTLDDSPLHQFPNYSNFLLEYWFLAKNLHNFRTLPLKLDNPYHHIMSYVSYIFSKNFVGNTIELWAFQAFRPRRTGANKHKGRFFIKIVKQYTLDQWWLKNITHGVNSLLHSMRYHTVWQKKIRSTFQPHTDAF